MLCLNLRALMQSLSQPLPLPVGLLLVCFQAAFASDVGPRTAVRIPVSDELTLRFSHLSFGDGPSRASVRQIAQDKLGFLWFGTQDGLRRYDGYRFREYRYQQGSVNGMSGTSVAALFADRAGYVWVASDWHLDRYDPASENFTSYAPAGAADKKFPGGINGINQDRDGIIWLATTNGIYRLEPATGNLKRYVSGLSSPHTTSTFEEKNGTFWIVTTEGLDAFDRRAGMVTHHLQIHQPGSASESGVPVQLLEDHAGVFWLTLPFGTGLAVLNRQALTISECPIAGQNSIEAIQEDESGAIWLASSENGVLKLDRDRKAVIRYRNSRTDSDSLSSDQVHALFEDRERNIWVGTQGGGINRVTSRPTPFRQYRHEPDNPNSLAKDEVTSVFEDSEGILWVGNRVALNRVDRKTGGVTIYRNTGGPRNLSNTYILSIAEDRSGYLWFGTSGGGLNRFDRRTGLFRVYRHEEAAPDSLSDDFVYSLFVDRQGTLWAGTDKGLDRFDSATQGFRTFRLPETGMSSYRAISEDASGGLWLATLVAGLQYFDPATGEIRAYRHSSDPASLIYDWVNAVLVDHSGMVWAGTSSGLARLDPRTGVFRAYYETDGLPNNNLSGILEDDGGDLWLSTNNGLSRFSPASGKFRNYYVADGIAGNEFYRRNGAWKSPGGEMFFCSTVGLTSFFPDHVVDNPYVPPVVLTDFLLSDKTVPVGSQSPLRQSISLTGSLVLHPEQNIFSFEFSALSFASPGRNRYRYRLENLETEWKERDSNHRTVTYTTLPPGHYTFRVQGSNNRGLWNEAGASIAINILPPWWSTWWFRGASALSLLALCWFAYCYRLNQITTQLNLRFEERLTERTRIARELHDTLLQGFQGLMLRLQVVDELLSEGRAKEELEQSLERADQAIAEGRDAVRDLRLSSVTTNDLAQAVRALGNELAVEDSADFRLVVEGPTRDLHPIVRDEIYRIVREALRNAFSHARAHHIEAEITYAERLFRLRIRDDGEGIAPAVLDEGRPGHYGLPGMRERAGQIGAKFSIWSSVRAGTEIELCIAASIAYGKSSGRSLFRLFRKEAPKRL
jgi:ligand-binding sensor domain-containing protein/signal transduction histidine kinase